MNTFTALGYIRIKLINSPWIQSQHNSQKPKNEFPTLHGGNCHYLCTVFVSKASIFFEKSVRNFCEFWSTSWYSRNGNVKGKENWIFFVCEYKSIVTLVTGIWLRVFGWVVPVLRIPTDRNLPKHRYNKRKPHHSIKSISFI